MKQTRENLEYIEVKLKKGQITKGRYTYLVSLEVENENGLVFTRYMYVTRKNPIESRDHLSDYVMDEWEEFVDNDDEKYTELTIIPQSITLIRAVKYVD